MKKNSDSDSEYAYAVERNNKSDYPFMDASIIRSISVEENESVKTLSSTIKRRKNIKAKKIIDYYNEGSTEQQKLEQEYNEELRKKKQNAIREKKYRERLKLAKEPPKVDVLLSNEDDSQSDIPEDILGEQCDPELKKKMQNVIRAKRYRERLKLKRALLEGDLLLINNDDSQSDEWGTIVKEELTPEQKKKMQNEIRTKRYQEQLKLEKQPPKVDVLLSIKDGSQSHITEGIVGKKSNPELKKKMQSAVRSKRYQEQLKLSKEHPKVDAFLLNRGGSLSNIEKEIKIKKQNGIRAKRYRERLKLAKERPKVDALLSNKDDSQRQRLDFSDELRDFSRNEYCLFSSLIQILQHQISTSELPTQQLQSPLFHTCLDSSKASQLRGTEFEGLDCISVFSRLLEMTNGVWPIIYS